MSDYAERIESIASKLRNLLEESEELKRLVEQRMMLEEDSDNSKENEDSEEPEESEASEQSENQESEEEQPHHEPPVITELVTRKPLCFFFCCRRY